MASRLVLFKTLRHKMVLYAYTGLTTRHVILILMYLRSTFTQGFFTLIFTTKSIHQRFVFPYYMYEIYPILTSTLIMIFLDLTRSALWARPVNGGYMYLHIGYKKIIVRLSLKYKKKTYTKSFSGCFLVEDNDKNRPIKIHVQKQAMISNILAMEKYLSCSLIQSLTYHTQMAP